MLEKHSNTRATPPACTWGCCFFIRAFDRWPSGTAKSDFNWITKHMVKTEQNRQLVQGIACAAHQTHFRRPVKRPIQKRSVYFFRLMGFESELRIQIIFLFWSMKPSNRIWLWGTAGCVAKTCGGNNATKLFREKGKSKFKESTQKRISNFKWMMHVQQVWLSETTRY